MALLAIPWLRNLAMGAAALAAVLGGLAWLRHDAANDARNEMAVEAAHTEQETRHEGNKAADAAARDGGIKRMQHGDF